MRLVQGPVNFLRPLAAGREVIRVQPVRNPALREMKRERFGEIKIFTRIADEDRGHRFHAPVLLGCDSAGEQKSDRCDRGPIRFCDGSCGVAFELCDGYLGSARDDYFFASLAQVSRKVIVRLKTGFPGRESGSSAK